MAVSKKQSENNVKSSLSFLFYFSKVFGIIPYSLVEYYKFKEFKLSLIGSFWSIICCLNFVLQYHFYTLSYMMFDKSSVETLTTVIGIFIIYMQPLMMIIDILAFLFQQKNLIFCLNRLEKVDQKLAHENIYLDYKQTKTNSLILIGITITCEVTLVLMNIFIFFTESFSLRSAMWIFSCGPLIINGIARTWFLQMLQLIQQRLSAINNYFDETKDLFFEKKLKMKSLGDGAAGQDSFFDENFGYLEKEIFTIRSNSQANNDKWDNLANKFNENLKTAPRYQNKKVIQVQPFEKPKRISSNFTVNDKMDKKLIVLCRLHDEICEIAKLINSMFSFQMLVTMAYGFMSITAQFYFLYCYLVGQDIPVLFRSASNIYISVTFILYTTYKCVIVIWIAYGTRSEAQKTGTELHKIANVVDENHFYSMCNHLSLKLLNHQLNFTACGFFDLDMTTIYSLTGAISSYLIIIIQFNLAANRPKTNSTLTMNSTMTTPLPLTFLNGTFLQGITTRTP